MTTTDQHLDHAAVRAYVASPAAQRAAAGLLAGPGEATGPVTVFNPPEGDLALTWPIPDGQGPDVPAHAAELLARLADAADSAEVAAATLPLRDPGYRAAAGLASDLRSQWRDLMNLTHAHGWRAYGESPASFRARVCANAPATRTATPGQLTYEAFDAVLGGWDPIPGAGPDWAGLNDRDRASWEVIAAVAAASFHHRPGTILTDPAADLLAAAGHDAHALASGVPAGRLTWDGAGDATRRAWTAAANAIIGQALTLPTGLDGPDQ